MNEELNELEIEELNELEEYSSFMDIFEELSFKEKWQKVSWGMKQDKDSGDYKYAKLQLMRLFAPLASVVVPILFIGLLILFGSIEPPPPLTVETRIMKAEEMPPLEEIEPIIEPPPEPPDPVDIDFTPDVTALETDNPQPPSEFSPQPAEFNAVAQIKSPVIFKDMYGSRTPGSRGKAIAGFGGSGKGELAVLRALRWLKKNQESEGNWSGNASYCGDNNKGDGKARTAYTSMALLTYLAHGETPSSEEFGPTVEKAIKFIIGDQEADGHFKSRDGHDYTHPIAAYALSEAYGLTKVPMLKEAATKAIKIVVRGQHLSGGWDYNCKQGDRDDTSYMGWCAQSLKAAKMAGLDVPDLINAINKAPKGFRKNCNLSQGSFGYTSPNGGGKGGAGLTGVGVLCMQLMGESKSEEVKNGLNYIQNKSRLGWDGSEQGMVYYWYYETQAMFHTGGDKWEKWNDMFAPALTDNQEIEKEAIEDVDGKLVDIGYWDDPDPKKSHGSRVQDTCLCTLQLEVYYRYLPTFQAPDANEDIELEDEDDEVDIDIDIAETNVKKKDRV